MQARTAEYKGESSATRNLLDPDRFFDPEPSVRAVARELYDQVRELPLVCPHGHVDPRLLAENEPFPEPTALLITPDHYILRMLYSRGVPLESMGIPARDGSAAECDPRALWRTFADHYYLFRGTPSGAWLDYELGAVFGIAEKLRPETAAAIYDELHQKLRSPEYLPRALFDRFAIEVLATTDKESDSLSHHETIRSSGWRGRVIPTFRPDAVFRIGASPWPESLAALEQSAGMSIDSFSGFIVALENRRAYFQSMGAKATDHGVVEPFTRRLSDAECERLFQKARRGEATAADQQQFEAHMLMEMARMSVEDGLVMQLHAGALRDHNQSVARRFGPDMGGDIPVVTEYTRNLQALLNEHGNDPRFRLVVFTLDESTYARELAPLAGHYPALRLGPPWWFNDSIEGMRRFRAQTTETAGIYNTAGFNDDTRAFCSIPARHDVARRMDANYLANLVVRHIVDIADAREMARALTYDLVKETYRLD